MGSGKWEVGSGKWEVGSGKWEVGSGKSEVGSRKSEVGSRKKLSLQLRICKFVSQFLSSLLLISYLSII